MTAVLVTRAAEDSARLIAELERAGFIVRACPLVRIEPVTGMACDATGFDWVVFTSRAGVRHGLPRLTGRLPRVAAVGSGTEEALREAGLEAELVPAVHTQQALVDALGIDPGRVLFPGAAEVAQHLIDAFDTTHLVVYRTVELTPPAVPSADLVVLASASAARALARLRDDLPCVSIGPTTSTAARAHGLEVVCEASSSDLCGLIAAVRLAASRLPSSA